MNQITDYTDYREFIKDRFTAIKQKNPHFSYRSFNRKAGIASSGFLKLVMDGKRNLGDSSIYKVAQGLGLSQIEFRLFELLVKFNQAKTHEEKDRYFQRLAGSKYFSEAKPMETAQYNLFSHWYYVAILEIVRLTPTSAKKDDKWIQSQCKPTVSLRDVKQAIKELTHLKLLYKDSDGNYQRNDTMISTPDEVASIAVTNFHMQMNELAKRSVQEDQADQREFSSITAAMSNQTFQRIKKEIQVFRKALHAIIEHNEKDPKEIVGHIHFCQFLISQPNNTNKHK